MNTHVLTADEAYYGTTQSQPARDTHTVGRWSLDVVEGALRNIRFEGIEIIRAVAFVVRDEDWGTCRPSIRDLNIEESASRFHLSYSADCINPRADSLSYEAKISCDGMGDLSFRVRWRTKTDFLTARAGFCVLHPIDGVAGAPACVTHSDGTVEHSHFPTLIDPWQPFKDIRAIEHRLQNDVSVRCTLLGDVFEMEDQRNWSDASFKTYSRPLELPWPYVMTADVTSEQAVTVQVKMNSDGRIRPSSTFGSESPIQVDIAVSDERMPVLGIAIAPEEVKGTLEHLSQLSELAPQRLTLQFDPAAGQGMNELASFAALQRQAGIPATLECVVPGIGEPREELSRVASMVADADLTLAGIFVSPAVHRLSDPPGSVPRVCPSMDQVYLEARRLFPGLHLGGGVYSYFTELNRKRPPLELVDWVEHATCPIVHAADDRSVMETLEAIPHITRSCRALIGKKPYSIGPISIGMRQNPYGSRTKPNPDRERITMADDDPRDHALFGAAWLTGYVAALCDSHIECITLGGFTGPRGLLASTGQRYPVFTVAQQIANGAGKRRLNCKSRRPDCVVAFGSVDVRGDASIFVANLTDRPQSVGLTGLKPLSLRPFECRQLTIPGYEAHL